MLGPNEVRPQLALVTWQDSVTGSGEDWEFLNNMKPLPPARVVSVGWIIDETDSYITLAGGLNDTQILGRMTIPVSAITEPVKRFNASEVGK